MTQQPIGLIAQICYDASAALEEHHGNGQPFRWPHLSVKERDDLMRATAKSIECGFVGPLFEQIMLWITPTAGTQEHADLLAGIIKGCTAGDAKIPMPVTVFEPQAEYPGDSRARIYHDNARARVHITTGDTTYTPLLPDEARRCGFVPERSDVWTADYVQASAVKLRAVFERGHAQRFAEQELLRVVTSYLATRNVTVEHAEASILNWQDQATIPLAEARAMYDDHLTKAAAAADPRKTLHISNPGTFETMCGEPSDLNCAGPPFYAETWSQADCLGCLQVLAGRGGWLTPVVGTVSNIAQCGPVPVVQRHLASPHSMGTRCGVEAETASPRDPLETAVHALEVRLRPTDVITAAPHESNCVPCLQSFAADSLVAYRAPAAGRQRSLMPQFGEVVHYTPHASVGCWRAIVIGIPDDHPNGVHLVLEPTGGVIYHASLDLGIFTGPARTAEMGDPLPDVKCCQLTHTAASWHWPTA